MKKLANQISQWLKDYAVSNNRKAFVIGVSGGVDSALVSTLCAMTGLPTHCVILPCYSKDAEIKRAGRHIDWLRSYYPEVIPHNVELSSTFRAFKNVVEDDYDNLLAYANTKSRLRMVALYQVATVYDGLVVGTGNKVEDFGVGFFTKYGDGGVDISPIADLTKTEVRKMASDLGVSDEIVKVAPTDGLWDDARTDESQLGATYEELEWAMDYSSKFHLLNDFLTLTSRQIEVLKIYEYRHKATAHKLEPIPTFIRRQK